MRNLAQRCAQVAKDTAALIEESITKSNDGKTKLDQVGEAIRSITESTTKVKTLGRRGESGQSAASQGHRAGSPRRLRKIEQVIQKTAASAEESASAAEELSTQSETVKDIVKRLSSMIDGDQVMAEIS